MNKQEFLAMSLPYGLHILNGKESDVVVGMVGDSVLSIFRGNLDNTWDITDVRPILHHLSDLTKEIEHKGERFVPIERFEIEGCNIGVNSLGVQIYTDECCFIYTQDVFENIHKYLLELHFDIADLISKGEAIDVNTLPENPYK